MSARYNYRSMAANHLGPMLVGHPALSWSHPWEVPDIDHFPGHGGQTVNTFICHWMPCFCEFFKDCARQRFPEIRRLAAGKLGLLRRPWVYL